MAKLVSVDLHNELAARSFSCIAAVCDSSRATDHAVTLSGTRLAVLRYVAQPVSADHTAIATMISQGDFIWGAIVYSESAEPDPLGLIESFHVSQLDQLVSRLSELREAFHEAG